MNNLKLILIFVLLPFMQCSVNKEEKEFYSTGEVKSISYYSKNIESPYLIEEYSKLGYLTAVFHFNKEGQQTGICYETNEKGDSIVSDYLKYPNYIEVRRYDNSKDQRNVSIYNDTSIIGISRTYIGNRLIRKSLYANERLLAYESYNYKNPRNIVIYEQEQSTQNVTDTLVIENSNIEFVGTQYQYAGENRFIPIGNYLKNKDCSIDKSNSTYFFAEIPDSISTKDSVSISIIGNYRNYKNIKYKLQIGEIDSFNALFTTPKFSYIGNIDKVLKLSLKPQEPGYHFFVGNIFVDFPNNRNQQFIIYDDFIVK